MPRILLIFCVFGLGLQTVVKPTWSVADGKIQGIENLVQVLLSRLGRTYMDTAAGRKLMAESLSRARIQLADYATFDDQLMAFAQALDSQASLKFTRQVLAENLTKLQSRYGSWNPKQLNVDEVRVYSQATAESAAVEARAHVLMLEQQFITGGVRTQALPGAAAASGGPAWAQYSLAAEFSRSPSFTINAALERGVLSPLLQTIEAAARAQKIALVRGSRTLPSASAESATESVFYLSVAPGTQSPLAVFAKKAMADLGVREVVIDPARWLQASKGEVFGIGAIVDLSEGRYYLSMETARSLRVGADEVRAFELARETLSASKRIAHRDSVITGQAAEVNTNTIWGAVSGSDDVGNYTIFGIDEPARSVFLSTVDLSIPARQMAEVAERWAGAGLMVHPSLVTKDLEILKGAVESLKYSLERGRGPLVAKDIAGTHYNSRRVSVSKREEKVGEIELSDGSKIDQFDDVVTRTESSTLVKVEPRSEAFVNSTRSEGIRIQTDQEGGVPFVSYRRLRDTELGGPAVEMPESFRLYLTKSPANGKDDAVLVVWKDDPYFVPPGDTLTAHGTTRLDFIIQDAALVNEVRTIIAGTGTWTNTPRIEHFITRVLRDQVQAMEEGAATVVMRYAEAKKRLDLLERRLDAFERGGTGKKTEGLIQELNAVQQELKLLRTQARDWMLAPLI